MNLNIYSTHFKYIFLRAIILITEISFIALRNFFLIPTSYVLAVEEPVIVCHDKMLVSNKGDIPLVVALKHR